MFLCCNIVYRNKSIYSTTFTDSLFPFFLSLNFIYKPITDCYILNSKGDNNYLPFKKNTSKSINK